jgi:16S rRNA (guanine527-N7)-methyltransferase
MDRNEFIKQVKKMYPTINDSFFDAIEIYKSFLYEYNQHTNLTRLDNGDLIYQNYFYDSIAPYQDLD